MLSKVALVLTPTLAVGTSVFCRIPEVDGATLTPQVKSIYVNSQPVSRPYGIVSSGTTYMPIWYVQQVLNQLGISNQWNGLSAIWTITSPSYMPVDLTNVSKSSSGTSSISLDGITTYRVNRIIYKDPASNTLTSYMPIWYIMQLLNRLGIGSSWNGVNWGITTPPPLSVTVADPSQYPTLDYGKGGYPVVLLQQKLNSSGYNVGAIDGQFGNATKVAVELFQASSGINADGIVGQETWIALNQRLATKFAAENSSNSASPGATSPGTATTASKGSQSVMVWATNGYSMAESEALSSITQINNDNYNLNSDGTVTDSTSGSNTLTNLLTYGQNNHVNVFATVTNVSPVTKNFDGSYTSSVLNNTTTRNKLESSLVNIATTDGYKGIDLDFENVNPSDQVIFTQFIGELAGELHAQNKELSVTLPAETGATSEPWNSAYNYAAIGNLADVVPIMTYDFSWPGSSPGAIAPLYWTEQVLKYATASIPPSKILMGLAAYGYDWNTSVGGDASALSLSKIDSMLTQYSVTPSWDGTDSSPYFTYKDASGYAHEVYYENEASIQQKLNLATEYGIAGVAVWKAGLEDSGFWSAIKLWATPATTPPSSSTQP